MLAQEVTLTVPRALALPLAAAAAGAPEQVVTGVLIPLEIADHPCALSFLLIPTGGSVAALLAPLGLAELEQ